MKITQEEKARILALDPKFFDLQVGQWYKHKFYNNFIVYKDNEKGYGSNDVIWGNYWSIISNYWVSASDKEVKDMLEKEARRRYKTGDFVKDLSSYNTEKSLNMESAYMQYYPSTNDMYFNGLLMYKEGKWAKIIEHPTEKSLMEEAKERGFVKGVYIDNTNIDFALKSEQISDADNYYLKGNDVLCIGGVYVYSKGKWAEIVSIENQAIEGAKYYKNSAYLFKEEFEEAYKLISKRLKNLAND